MPIIETKGAASSQGFGQFASTGEAVYIESVFQTWLYTGNSSTQTITNGIDLSTKGGLVWVKNRSNSLGVSHYLVDTVRGEGNYIQSNSTGANTYRAGVIGGFSTTGFSVDASANTGTNLNSNTYASWTFRKQPKFFDVVTYTGNNTNNRQISHNLGSVPGCIIVKCTSSNGAWWVYHRSIGFSDSLFLNSTSGLSGTGIISATSSTTFTIPSATDGINDFGASYVAYLFAHDAGGFGLTGTDNVISCGSVTNTTTVNLGYEPQWIMLKRTDSTSPWYMIDNMRGMDANYGDNYLAANSSAAEALGGLCALNATGMTLAVAGTYIYIAIRRGPMKTPTSGTSVFSPNAYSGTGTSTIQTLTTNFPVDAYIQTSRQDSTTSRRFGNRLTGQEKYLLTNLTAAEQTIGSGNGVNNTVGFASNTGIGVQGDWNNPSSPAYSPYIMWNFRRAPGFFDVVCYTGTGSARTVTHNLGVAPELMIIKVRNNTSSWFVWGGNMPITNSMFLNQTQESLDSAPYFNDTLPTASVFSVSSAANFNGETLVAYLFASCPGVSKVGSYTGTGALQTINCSFTGGARFVLIKRTDSTGDWWVYDSARGMSSGNDPYLFLNSTDAEVTGTNYVDTTSVGFQVTAAAPAGLNANGGTYIFLAIA